MHGLRFPAVKTIPVNEVFESIQGEATFAGMPSVFVRLQGCDVGCPWCDTKETWAVDPDWQVPADVMLAKQASGQPSYARLTEGEIIKAVAGYRARHVVFTGGEPCEYDLAELTCELHRMGFTTQVETSGTAYAAVAEKTWVTVSPKVDMPGKRKLIEMTVQQADEIKMPVGKPADIDRLKAVLKMRATRCPVWLQPLSTSDKATQLCIEAATAHAEDRWRVSLQVHKFIGAR